MIAERDGLINIVVRIVALRSAKSSYPNDTKTKQ